MDFSIINIGGFEIIEVIITDQMISEAKELYEFGELNNSVTKGKSNMFGAMGEIIVKHLFKCKQASTYNYDLITKKGKKIDVKTRRCNTTPKKFYNVGVFDFNTTQKCDHYCFTRIKEDLSKGWILGYMDKNEFYKKATFHKKGEIDKKSTLGWKIKADSHDMEIKDLYSLGDYLRENIDKYTVKKL